jgi:hypothetical protein
MILIHRPLGIAEAGFAYCLGRILAQRFSYKFEAFPFAGFQRTLMSIPGEELLSPLLTLEGQWPRDAQTGRPLEPSELHMAPSARIALRGMFQRFELIAEFRDEIRNDWFQLDTPFPVRNSNEFLVCLNERKIGNSKPTSDWRLSELQELCRTVNYKHLFFLVTEPSIDELAMAATLGADLLFTTDIDRFRLIHSFQKVAISQNVLHWWAVFLGKAREIYFPPIDRGEWSHPKPAIFQYEPDYWGIDLRVLDEAQWIYKI